MLLAAGGTGGHLFPAEALAHALGRRGITVDLATDERAERYGSRFPAREIHVIASDTLRARNPLSLARTGAMLGIGAIAGVAAARTHQAGRRGRLRRLSDLSAGAGGGAAQRFRP